MLDKTVENLKTIEIGTSPMVDLMSRCYSHYFRLPMVEHRKSVPTNLKPRFDSVNRGFFMPINHCLVDILRYMFHKNKIKLVISLAVNYYVNLCVN